MWHKEIKQGFQKHLTHAQNILNEDFTTKVRLNLAQRQRNQKINTTKSVRVLKNYMDLNWNWSEASKLEMCVQNVQRCAFELK